MAVEATKTMKSMDYRRFASQYLERLKGVINKFDVVLFDQMVAATLDAYEREAHIFVMGNGGSGTAASHLACDINKGCCFDLDKKFKMICLNDNMPTWPCKPSSPRYMVMHPKWHVNRTIHPNRN